MTRQAFNDVNTPMEDVLRDLRELLLIIARSLPPQDNDLITEFMRRKTIEEGDTPPTQETDPE